MREQSWIPLITAEPPALVKDIPHGFQLSEREVSPLVSYDDLARAMVQMAEDAGGQKGVGKGVGIRGTGNVKKDVLPLIRFQVIGLFAYFFPSFWRLGSGMLW